MSNWYSAWLDWQIRDQDIVRDLARRQLAQAALGDHGRQFAFPGKVLLTLGCWFVERGWQLHHRHDAAGTDVFQWGHFEIRARSPVTEP